MSISYRNVYTLSIFLIFHFILVILWLMLLQHHFSPDTLPLLSRQPWAAFAKEKKKKKRSLSSILFQPGNQAISPQNGGTPLLFSSCVLLRVGFTCMRAAGRALCCRACEIGPWRAFPRWPVSGHRLGGLWEEGDLPGGITGELRTARALPANSAPATWESVGLLSFSSCTHSLIL